jgi:hypothetical protein
MSLSTDNFIAKKAKKKPFVIRRKAFLGFILRGPPFEKFANKSNCLFQITRFNLIKSGHFIDVPFMDNLTVFKQQQTRI